MAALRLRLTGCFDVFPRLKTAYYWPPRSGRIATGRGALLVLETLSRKLKSLTAIVKRLHSDELPFIGSVRIEEVNPAYRRWLQQELRPGL